MKVLTIFLIAGLMCLFVIAILSCCKVAGDADTAAEEDYRRFMDAKSREPGS